MGELFLVGLGLFDELDLSARGLGELKRCRTVFAEEYTAVLREGTLERLASLLGRPVLRLDRGQVEDPRIILDALADPGRNPVGFLTAGDPFAATTHVALRLSAEKAGHRWTYRPNASILTAAAGFLGLMPYRFGRPASIPLPDPRFAPRSPLEAVHANRAAGAHTLLLLDLRPGEGRFLRAEETLQIISARDPTCELIPRDALLAVVARVGSPTEAAWVGRRDELSGQEFGPPLHCLVVTAPTLHFEEEEALARFRGPWTSKRA